MLLWIVFAILTALTLFAVLAPLMRQSSRTEQPASAADIAVYRDQLTEIEIDMERGLIGKEEAANAKIEISRRLLHRSEAADFSQSSDKAENDAEGGAAPTETGGLSKPLFYGASLFIPVFAVLLYLSIGSPNMPGLPHAARIEAPRPGAKIEVLVANVEAHLRKNPTDGKGWDVLAPVYLRQQRYNDSAGAYARALELLGETPKRLSGFAMATISSNNGIVTDEARLAYERLLRLKPGRADVKYWLAVAKEQDGRIRQAANDMREMLRTAKADAPWRAMVQQHLNGLDQRLGNPTAKAALTPRQGAGGGAGERGPSAADIAAAAKMSTQDRSQMINQMVGRLATRLKEEGKDLGGWRKLVRAYVVLGKPDKARQALTQARKNFGGDSAALAALDQLASQFKL